MRERKAAITRVAAIVIGAVIAAVVAYGLLSYATPVLHVRSTPPFATAQP